MPNKIIKGKENGNFTTISYEEARDIEDKALTELLYYMKSVIDEATDDEEERSDLSVNLSAKVGIFRNACVMRGVLMDPDSYLESIGIPPELQVTITEDCDGQPNS